MFLTVDRLSLLSFDRKLVTWLALGGFLGPGVGGRKWNVLVFLFLRSILLLLWMNSRLLLVLFRSRLVFVLFDRSLVFVLLHSELVFRLFVS